MNTLSAALSASRPISWINTAFPFGAAYILAGGLSGGIANGWPAVDFWVGCVFFLIPYNLLMYGVNDVFDYASDVANPRKGGVEGALLPPHLHRPILVLACGVAAPFVVYFLVRSIVLGVLGSASSWWACTVLVLSVFVLSVFAVLAYSVKGLRFKEVPFLDSVTSSVHFSSPAWFGLALGLAAGPVGGDSLGSGGSDLGPGATLPHLGAGTWLVLAAFFLWGCASHAFGAVQDVVPDRAGGIRSVATVLGARATVWFSLVLYGLAGALMLFTGWPLALGAVLAVPYLVNVGRFARVTDADSGRANRGWKWFIPMNYVVGFLVTLLMIWVAAG